jgi:hypothetical protein
MEYKDREKIDRLCNQLLQAIDIDRLWPKLLENQVYNRDDVNIPNWQVRAAPTLKSSSAISRPPSPRALRPCEPFAETLVECGYRPRHMHHHQNKGPTRLQELHSKSKSVWSSTHSGSTGEPHIFQYH